METLTIELPTALARALGEVARAEGWPSPAAFVRELVEERLQESDEARLAWLREAVRVGDESGPDISLEELDAQLKRTIDQERKRAA